MCANFIKVKQKVVYVNTEQHIQRGGGVVYVRVLMSEKHKIGFDLGLKRHIFMSKQHKKLCLVFLGMLHYGDFTADKVRDINPPS